MKNLPRGFFQIAMLASTWEVALSELKHATSTRLHQFQYGRLLHRIRVPHTVRSLKHRKERSRDD